jgi:multisubunit Na+/H+ antiporter MnhF subunit
MWLVGATFLLLGLIPCGLLALRDSRVDALVGLQVGGSVATLVLMLLAEGFSRSAYMGLPLALALVAFVGGLVAARFLGGGL